MVGRSTADTTESDCFEVRLGSSGDASTCEGQRSAVRSCFTGLMLIAIAFPLSSRNLDIDWSRPSFAAQSPRRRRPQTRGILLALCTTRFLFSRGCGLRGSLLCWPCQREAFEVHRPIIGVGMVALVRNCVLVFFFSRAHGRPPIHLAWYLNLWLVSGFATGQGDGLLQRPTTRCQ